MTNQQLETLLKQKGKGSSGGMLSAEEFRALMVMAPAPRMKYADRSMETFVNRVGAVTGVGAARRVQTRVDQIKQQLGY